MFVRRLQAHNFKSFAHLDLTFEPFVLLLGSNAAGKSNLLDLFRLLRDVERHGLVAAIARQGGPSLVTNTAVGVEQPLRIAATVGPRTAARVPRRVKGGRAYVHTYTGTYAFEIGFSADGHAPVVRKEEMAFDLQWNFAPTRGKARPIGTTRVIRRRRRHTIESSCVVELDRRLDLPEFGRDPFDGMPLSPQALLLETPCWKPLSLMRESLFASAAIFDFDPHCCKTAVPVGAMPALSEDGANLAAVLDRLLQSGDCRRQLTNLLADLLPFVEELRTSSAADHSVLWSVKEAPGADFMPATALSDGTACGVALVLALFFQPAPLVILEEPERNLHPYLLARVMQMMREAALERQILVTTHNPELVRHAALSEVFLATRDKTGFSHITRAQASERVRRFLGTEIGLDDLYVQNLLDNAT